MDIFKIIQSSVDISISSYSWFFKNILTVLKSSIPTLFLIFLIFLVAPSYTALIIPIFIWLIFSAAFHLNRLIVLEESISLIKLIQPSKKVFIFIIYFFIYFLSMGLIEQAFLLLTAASFLDLSFGLINLIFIIIGCLLSAYLFSSLSILLPAVAVDRDLKSTWMLSKQMDTSIQILISTILVILPLMLIGFLVGSMEEYLLPFFFLIFFLVINIHLGLWLHRLEMK